MKWYEDKAARFYAEWERATDAGDSVAADKAMTEYVNYMEFIDRNKKNVK